MNLLLMYTNQLLRMKTYKQKGKDTLLIINHKTSKKVFIHSVVLLKGNINYTTLYFQNGKEKVIAHTLKFFETFLQSHGFLRIHRSFMINPYFVKEYNQTQEYLTMSNGQIATISRRKKHTLKELYG